MAGNFKEYMERAMNDPYYRRVDEKEAPQPISPEDKKEIMAFRKKLEKDVTKWYNHFHGKTREAIGPSGKNFEQAFDLFYELKKIVYQLKKLEG